MKLSSYDKLTAALEANGWDFSTKDAQVSVPVPGTAGYGFGARADREVVPGLRVAFSGQGFTGPTSGVVFFTAAGSFVRDLSYAGPIYSQPGHQSFNAILSNVEQYSPRAAAARRAEAEAKATAQREAKEAANLAKEQAASAERTRLQGEVYNLVINAASARTVTGVNTSSHLRTPEPKDIAVEIVCLLQQDDSPLVALVDAYRTHLAAEAGVRADRLERDLLAQKGA